MYLEKGRISFTVHCCYSSQDRKTCALRKATVPAAKMECWISIVRSHVPKEILDAFFKKKKNQVQEKKTGPVWGTG